MGVTFRPLRDEFPAAFAGLERRIEVQERIPSGLKTIGPHHLAVIPAARATRTANLSIPNNALTTVTWDTEFRDTADMFNTGVNPSRITAPIPGLYMAEAGAEFVSNATGYRRIFIVPTGTGTILPGQGYTALSGTATVIQVSATIEMVAGSYIEVSAFQNSGAALDLQGGTSRTYMALTWMGNV